jgi:hypothetical protein
MVIANKSDDVDRDVVWQVMKYVSYCSTMKSSQIVEICQEYLDGVAPGQDAEGSLLELMELEALGEKSLNSDDQRMVLVAADYQFMMAEKDREKSGKQASIKGIQVDRLGYWRYLLGRYKLVDDSLRDEKP